MRDYKKLQAFELADELAIAVYRHTRNFPSEERFGLTSQMRRCAVSIPSNIVEGCGRTTRADYLRFLDIAYGSACELEYQISLATRLGFLEEKSSHEISQKCSATARILNALINSLKKSDTQSPANEKPPEESPPLKPEVRSPKPVPHSGMVLLVVVIIVALLSLAGYAFVALMNSELDATRQRGREMQMHYVTQSGVSLLESVATLSQFDRGWTGGTYDNPSLFCAAAMTDDWSAVQASARFTVVSPKIDGGRMSGIRYGLVNESAKLNLAKVLEWETANPGDGVNALRKLPGMSVQTAEAILDWIDADNNARAGGAEAAYYTQMRLPYKPRNAVPVTLEEFLLVRGVTRQLMFGDDENFNFVPDSQEARMAADTLPTSDGMTPPGNVFDTGAVISSDNATPAVPWVHLLTVVSAERDANPRGAARIDLNQANLEFLREQLAERVSPEAADFVVLYRQYGTPELNAATQTPDATNASATSSTAATSASSRRTRARGGRASVQSSPDPNGDIVPDTTIDMATSVAPLDLPSGLSGETLPNAMFALPPPLAIPDAAPAPPTVSTVASSQTSSNASANTTSRIGGTSRNGRESRFSQYVDYRIPAKFRFETPLDVVNVAVEIPRQGTTIKLESPLTVDSSSLNSTLPAYLDEVSTSPNTTVVGRININEATYEVMAGIPGLSQNKAQEIVNRRERSANGIRDMYRHPTWLLAFDVVDLGALKALWPHITCGGDVFRAQVIGFYEDIGTFSRVEIAVDATVYPPRRIDYKDLTSYGIGFHDRVLFGTISQQSSTPGAVGTTAPTLADRSVGGSLADYNADYGTGNSTSGFGMGMSSDSQSSYVSPNYSDIAPLEIPGN